MRTRLTERFDLKHPVVSAPMGFVAGGKLAAAVSHAGGLGLIGGGYGDREWLAREFSAAGNAEVGCGFITWSLAKSPSLLDTVLARSPRALMLSFGSPESFAGKIADAGIPLICQVQTLGHVREAIAAGAAVIVAQGSEAGGHGARRATLTLVPEVADYLAQHAPQTLLLAAGGVADGRGLAAALMLGADGVLIGSRFLASTEALVPDGFREALVRADGDSTVRTTVIDKVRGFDWPSEFDGRSLRTNFVMQWHGREDALQDPEVRDREGQRYWTAFQEGDVANTGVFAGEAVGLITEVKPAAEIIDEMVSDAERLLREANARYF